MKKKLGAILIALVLVVALAVPMAMPVAADTESSPQTQILYAGQDIDVGTVSVWNDLTYLYVTYEITDPDWVITETHLYVGKTDPNTGPPTGPLTSAPGQFPYDDDDATVTDTMVTYVILLADIDGYHMKLNKKDKPTGVMVADGSLGVDSDGSVFIAAHAGVEKTIEIAAGYSDSGSVVSGAGTDDVVLYYEDAGNLGYPDLTPIYTGLSVLAYEHTAWNDVAGAQWIGSAYSTENTDNNTWRLFTRSFDLPTDAVNIAGHLQMNCDNAETADLNGAFVGADAVAPVYGTSPTATGPVNHGYGTLEDFDLTNFIAGTNTLVTMTRNYGWLGGSTGNPTGYAYKLDYSYDVLPVYETQTETAWGNGDPFGTNWAMYFEYHIQSDCNLVGNWDHQAVFGSTTYYHDMTIETQDAYGNFTGVGVTSGGVTWTVVGTISNSDIDMMIVYSTGYWAHNWGTIAEDCMSMGGDWEDSNGKTGTWSDTRSP